MLQVLGVSVEVEAAWCELVDLITTNRSNIRKVQVENSTNGVFGEKSILE
jgi:hypothetical protein